jgi:hypothetical protein
MVYSVGANTGFLYVKCDYQTKVGKIYGMDWSSHFKTEGLCLALSTFPPCFPFTWLRKACLWMMCVELGLPLQFHANF